MKKRLADIFRGRCVKMVPENVGDYHWYLDEEKAIIGLCKDITETEKLLVDLNYMAIQISAPTEMSKLLWLHYLTTDYVDFAQLDAPATTVRFIFFYHDFNQNLQFEFEQLMQDYDERLICLFLDLEYGVIIEKHATDLEEEMNDFLLAARHDFSSSLIFYQTVAHVVDGRMKEKYLAEFALFKAFKDQRIDVMGHGDLFLNYLMSSDVIGQHPIFATWFESVLTLEVDLLRVVKCYLESGSNVSTVSKKMHMHRNTIMNKLDRFFVKTGLDMKQFDQAVIAYLLIQLTSVK